MLKIENLHVSYGAIHAIKGVSLTVNDGEIVSLIGANGAGKTTILHTITGLISATQGIIEYDGVDLRKAAASNIVSMGLAHVPEGRHVFTRMTVEENLLMGAFHRKKSIADLEGDLEAVYDSFPRLKERQKQLSGTLSGGEQQMLATGRAMMSKPKMIVMDEPSMGLAPLLVREVFHIIEKMHDSGITVLLVEQNAKMALSISDRAYVLETGRIAMEGNAEDLMNDDRVKKAYLGA